MVLFGIIFIMTFTLRQRFNYLHKRAKQQQELSRKLLESQEEERKRIGAMLNDSPGQDLLVMKKLTVAVKEEMKQDVTASAMLDSLIEKDV